MASGSCGTVARVLEVASATLLPHASPLQASVCSTSHHGPSQPTTRARAHHGWPSRRTDMAVSIPDLAEARGADASADPLRSIVEMIDWYNGAGPTPRCKCNCERQPQLETAAEAACVCVRACVWLCVCAQTGRRPVLFLSPLQCEQCCAVLSKQSQHIGALRCCSSHHCKNRTRVFVLEARHSSIEPSDGR